MPRAVLLRSSYLRVYWAAISGRLCGLFLRQNLDVPQRVRLQFCRRKSPQIRSKSGSPTSLLNMNSLVSIFLVMHGGVAMSVTLKGNPIVQRNVELQDVPWRLHKLRYIVDVFR